VNLTIDKSSAEPAYEQISRQIEELVQQGLLGPGARIPSIRQLAQRLGLANSTVARETATRMFMRGLLASSMSEIARDNSSAQRRSVYGSAGERRRRWKNQQMRQHCRPFAPE